MPTEKIVIYPNRIAPETGFRLFTLVLVAFALLILLLNSMATGADNSTQPVQNLTPLANQTPAVPLASQTPVVKATLALPTGIPHTDVLLPGPDPVLEQQFTAHKVMPMHNVTPAEREAAAARVAEAKAALNAPGVVTSGTGQSGIVRQRAAAMVAAGGVPDYFGSASNYANSQLPIPADALGNATPGTGIRKFVDTLPGLGPSGANNLGNYIPVALSDANAYPGSDYYEIGLVQYVQKMHSDLAPTTLRGYVQLETPGNAGTSQHVALQYPDGTPIRNASGVQVYGYEKPRYLGPAIVAQKDKPVRIKFTNYLPTGSGGNLFIPVDKTMMGAGQGPLGANGTLYSENRATVHLHGGNTPWISDGTPHQWTTPAGENSSYPEGVSVSNVPDMDGGNEPVGTLTFYYTNQQSARLMFYHDHAYGITRLNVYAGEAAPYLVGDSAEASLVASGALPSEQIPLVIQDKSFIPNATQMVSQDPTWNWGNTSTPWPHTGDLYYPHVYMPIQNPYDRSGVNAKGRWDYGPWVWPPYSGFFHQPLTNPFFDPVLAPWEPEKMPATPNPSQTPESFVDTAVVNGQPYPVLKVGPHAYRFRILNAANDRSVNLQLYYAGSSAPMWSGTTLLNKSSGEVNMVPALPGTGLPPNWPTDGRAGGVPDPTAAGPSWIQVGTEGGFLPAPVIIPPQPIDFDYHLRSVAVLNMLNRSLFLQPAERADVIVDFSGIPSGSKLILYNDAPAPAPGGDPRYDYYTGDPDQTSTGGAPTTLAGYGPNTRTLMQIVVDSTIAPPPTPFSLNTLNASLPGAYAQYQDKPIVPEKAYSAPFGTNYPTNTYVQVDDTTISFTPADQTQPISMDLQQKAIFGSFESDYGRLNALLGTEIPRTPTSVESSVASGYIDPPTELFNNSVKVTPIGSLSDGTQIFKITNNDVDLHPVHWHMVNLQVINRVIWDGTIQPPAPNELGWKETIEAPPLTDTIVALRPITPTIPWEVPNSIRPLDPTMPLGTTMQFTGLDPTGVQVPVINHLVNYGWEYVWHCHILGHEESDFMHVMSVAVTPKNAPTGLITGNVTVNGTKSVYLAWRDNSVSETHFTVQRATTSTGPWSDIAQVPSATGRQSGLWVMYIDTTVAPNARYYYRVEATNIVGDSTPYAAPAAGFPWMAVNSSPSNTAFPVNAALPTVAFNGTPTLGSVPFTVQFMDQSTNSPTGWTWSFGDGSSVNATRQNPVHTYTRAGTYTVSLTATTIGGNRTLTKSNYIVAYNGPIPPPVTNFTATPRSGTMPLTVVFTDLSTNSPTGWAWSFGDGVTTNYTQQNPVHTYNAGGNFTVSLTATNAAGSNKLTRALYINVTSLVLPPPVISTITPSTGYRNSTVTFNITGSNFQPGFTTVTFRNATGDTLNTVSLTSVTATQINGRIVVPYNAWPGVYNVNISTLNGGSTPGTGLFTVVPALPPTITSITPSVGYPTTSVTYTIAGTNFKTGQTTVIFRNATGAILSNPGVTSVTSTRITGTMAIPANAWIGLYNVNVGTIDGGTTVGTGLFNIARPLPPTLTSISSTARYRNTTSTFTITGANYVPGLTTVIIRNATGSVLNTATLTSINATQIKGSIAIPANAWIGPYNVEINTPFGSTTAIGFFSASAYPAPTITSVIPTSITRGTAPALSISGRYYEPGLTSAALTRTGAPDIPVSVNSVTSVLVQGTATVSGSVTPGTWNVRITTADGGTTTRTNAITIV